MRVGFMGTPEFSVPILQAIIDQGHAVPCVYTQPPRPKGRGQQVQKSPVHVRADENGIPVFTPKSLKKDEAARAVFATHDLDVCVVAAYGLILPQDVLDAPRHGCLNVHGSLLPRWRGAAPIQHAIWAGDAQTGICIMQMEAGLDTGPVALRRAVPIGSETTAENLYNELSTLGAEMTAEVLAKLAQGNRLDAVPQDDRLSNYAPLLKKEDGRIDWGLDAAAIDRQLRALAAWPGVFTTTGDGKRLKILAAEINGEMFIQPPGTIIDRAGHVACGGDTGLRLIRVQPDNGKPMDMPSAINGGYLKIDEVLG